MILLKNLLLLSLLGPGSCSINPKKFILTEAATRLAYDIESAALKLETSDQNSTEIKHTPWAYSDGVKGDYKVWLCPTTRVPHPREPGRFMSRSLKVHRYSTSYHCRFVSIPEFLQRGEKAGEPTYLLLKKTNKPWNYHGGGKTLCGNKTIEITSIRLLT